MCINKELIKTVINNIPSKDLRNAYNDEIAIDIYPKWEEDDALVVFEECHLKNHIELYNEIISLLKDENIKNRMANYHKELMHRGKYYRDSRRPNFLDKYVSVKNIFKGGDLVKYIYCGKSLFGVIGNFNYNDESKNVDSTDIVYNCFIIENYYKDEDLINPYFVYGSHCHPIKMKVEKADISELTIKQKRYYDILIEKYVFSNSKMIFDEYDSRYINKDLKYE